MGEGFNKHNFPPFNTLVEKFDLIKLTLVFREYFTWRFNTTKNIGDTLSGEFSGILHFCRQSNLFVTGDWFPGVSPIFKGANRIAQNDFGKRVRQGKRALFLPMIKAMCKVATDLEKAIILVAHQGMLRAEHYSDKGIGNKYLRMRDIYFEPNMDNPEHLVLWNKHDKNHPFKVNMARSLPCRCKTNWPCAVHALLKVIKNDKRSGRSQLLQCREGKLTYSALQKIVKELCRKIGLNDEEYGSHSLRAGGATEAFLEGKDSLWIQMFGHWESIDSVKGYVRPRNPEIYLFINSLVKYEILRRKEGEGLDPNYRQVETIRRAKTAKRKRENKRSRKKAGQQVVIFQQQKKNNPTIQFNVSKCKNISFN